MMRTHQLPVLSNRQVSDRYWHMKVDASSVEEQIEPGQFFHIRCADKLYPFLRRPFSIYRIGEGYIEFLYLVKGLGTEEMTRHKAGDTLDVMGPVGVGFTLPEMSRSILLVGRGVGIATLAALAQVAVNRKVACTAILSARSSNDLLAADFLTQMGANVIKVTDDDGSSEVGRVKTVMERLIEEDAVDAVYTCGSRRLSRLGQEAVEEYGLFGEIALEENMGCAMGACFACVSDIKDDNNNIQSVRVCLEGPVFPLEKVVL